MTQLEKIQYARSVLNNVTMQAVLAISRHERRQEERTPDYQNSLLETVKQETKP
jgi:hypothetical protein